MSAQLVQTRVRTPSQRWRIGTLLLGLHVVPVLALATGTKPMDWMFFAWVYPIQAIGLGLSLHRYFAHRSFKTSRFFQFLLALASASAFGDPIGFAGKHRLHHQHVDTQRDVHTPLHGWWSCWIGNLLDSGYTHQQILSRVEDLRRFPELMILHKYSKVPGLLLIAAAYASGGFSTAAIGVCLGAVLLLHQTSAVNYFSHKWGSRRFDLPDHSTNNWVMGVLAYGEGWHNNHHRYPGSARAGFFWWEIDMFYWLICCLEKLGIVWDVRRPPAHVYAGDRGVYPEVIGLSDGRRAGASAVSALRRERASSR